MEKGGREFSLFLKCYSQRNQCKAEGILLALILVSTFSLRHKYNEKRGFQSLESLAKTVDVLFREITQCVLLSRKGFPDKTVWVTLMDA